MTNVLNVRIGEKEKQKHGTIRNSCLVLVYTKHPSSVHFITETCLDNVDPLKPHFYIVKLGITRVYIIFLISVQKIDCGYS